MATLQAAEPAPVAAPTGLKGKAKGWLKALLGTVAGLLSGAVMMYLSPLVDKVLKPAKPVANFEVERQGLTVTLYNRSVGHVDGWWDFGDGSPLEPANPKQPSVTHTYSSASTYTAKLTIHNLLGDENERAVTIQLDSQPVNTAPAILSLEAVPVSGNAYAPATFRISCKTSNAQLCVWSYDDDRPLEFLDPAHSEDRLVTFPKAGGWVVKLAAVNGSQAVERSTVVSVEEPPRGVATALLTVTEQASRVERIETPITVVESFAALSRSTLQPINRTLPARQGYEIASARLEQVSGNGGQDLKVQVSADRRSARLTGELVRDSGGLFQRKAVAPNLALRVVLVQEQRVRVTRPPTVVVATLPMPGTGMLPLPPVPADWENVQRQLRIELREGEQVIWPQSPLPHNASLTMHNQPCTVNAATVGDQVQIDVTAAPPGTSISAN